MVEYSLERTVSAAGAYYMALAYKETVEPLVLRYQKKILEQKQWPVHHRFHGTSGNVVLNPDNVYLLSDEHIQEYVDLCYLEMIEVGLKVREKGNCPLLEARAVLLDNETSLIKVALEELPKNGVECPDFKQLEWNFPARSEFVRLILNLVSEYVKIKRV